MSESRSVIPPTRTYRASALGEHDGTVESESRCWDERAERFVTGEELLAIIADAYAAPPDVIAQTVAALGRITP